MRLNAWQRLNVNVVCISIIRRGSTSHECASKGKLYWKKLETDDLAVAKRKLRGLKDDLERTDETKG